jgi:cell division septum initiation protein DivIVA
VTTFNATYFAFDEEVERLDEKIEALREEAAELEDADDPPEQRIQQLVDEAQDLQAQRKGAVWARDRAYESEDFPHWDTAVDGVTLGAVRAGVYGGVQNDVGADPDAGEGTVNTLFVAEATITDPDVGEEAPYVGADMSTEAQTAAVASLHPWYIQWAKSRIDELLDPESGNGSRSGSSPAENSAEETSTDD